MSSHLHWSPQLSPYGVVWPGKRNFGPLQVLTVQPAGPLSLVSSELPPSDAEESSPASSCGCPPPHAVVKTAKPIAHARVIAFIVVHSIVARVTSRSPRRRGEMQQRATRKQACIV